MSTTETNLKTNPMRAVLAWAGACYVGVWTGIVCMQIAAVVNGGHLTTFSAALYASYYMTIGAAICTAPFSLLFVFVMRVTRMPRPWADVIGGAAIAMAGSVLPEVLYFPPVTAALLPYAMFGGFAAGTTYWHLAGKPRPPYEAA